MSLRSVATVLVLSAAALAPWTSAGNTRLPIGGWWLGALLVAGFLLLCAQRIAERRFLQVPWPILAPVLFLLGCLAWWATNPEPEFSTGFGAEHWRFLESASPSMIFQWPRFARLAFLASALLGFLAAADLGSSAEFRRRLFTTIGLSGLALALYALGMRWLSLPALPWIDRAPNIERFNVSFFHHSGPGACLNLAWPLLVFCAARTAGKRVAVVLIAAAALPLWHSFTAPGIAASLLIAGVVWKMRTATSKIVSSFLIRSLVAALFLAIGLWQWRSLQSLRAQPDGWVSAAQTQLDAPVRDAAVRAAALTRRDRLVPSETPPRPAAWLAAARMAADYPVIGPGPGAWGKRAVLYSNDTIVSTFYQHRQFAHSDLLQTAAEWGGLSALAWLAIWIGALWRATSRESRTSVAEPGLVLALVGIAVHSTVHSPLQNPALLLWTVLLLGLAWSPRDHSEARGA